MATTEQKRRVLKAKIAVALHDELGRVPTQKEIEQVFLLTRVMYSELTPYLPFELVDDVLEQTRTVQRRLRDLPATGWALPGTPPCG